MELIGTIILG